MIKKCPNLKASPAVVRAKTNNSHSKNVKDGSIFGSTLKVSKVEEFDSYDVVMTRKYLFNHLIILEFIMKRPSPVEKPSGHVSNVLAAKRIRLKL